MNPEKKYKFMKTVKKFLVGGGMATLGMYFAGRFELDQAIVLPIFVGAGEGIWGLVEFFYNRKQKRSVISNA